MGRKCKNEPKNPFFDVIMSNCVNNQEKMHQKHFFFSKYLEGIEICRNFASAFRQKTGDNKK